MHAAEQNREDVKRKREEWRAAQKTLKPEQLIFVDESSVNTGMTRLYGRAAHGVRVVDYVPDVRYHATTIVSSVRLDGTIIPVAFEGALNGDIFKIYITQFLVPSLKHGDIVIMDNLSSHKVSGIAQAITEVGASVLFLPPYSPDLNPIELMWSKMKAILRKLKVRCEFLLIDGIANALDSVSPSDISGWFSHDGYRIC